MFQRVEIPLWLLILILLFAAVTFLSHFLFPSVRWFFRRRMERAVAELNKRLERPIQPFKLARRFDTVQRLVYDREVMAAIAEHAAEEGIPENVAMERARRYAREIVPSFSTLVYYRVTIRIARWLSRKLYDVRVGGSEGGALQKLDPDATVIFVMNHRSNMDYVLITYLVAENSALSYAVGEWARVWPLSWLIRSMGAYFIRRRSRNALYRRVLARYVQMATEAGVTQAFFPEGGLSLDGRVGPPKLGLLSYVLSAFNPDGGRDVVFVPVALNYDRVLEDRLLTEAAAEGERRFRGSIGNAVRFVIRYVWRRWRGQAVRFGHAGVRFGAPLSLRAYLAEHPGRDVKEVGRELRARIRAVLPVLAAPLVAFLVRSDGPLPRAALVAAAQEVLDGLPDPLVGRDAEAVVAQGLANLTSRAIVEETGGNIRAVPANAALLDYYANSAAQGVDLAVSPPGVEFETT